MKRVAGLFVVFLGLFAVSCAGSGPEPAKSASKQQELTAGSGNARRFALLVGCTNYDNYPTHSLQGPANDVKLMRERLVEHFGFDDQNIVTLAEGAGAAKRPTRANIKREFDRMIANARKGDEFFVLLSGHGSQQPDHPPYDEPDGLDQVFLPADAGPWDAAKEVITNAIVDDELGVWTKAIVDKGAHLCFVADSCHSGTLLRGGDSPEVVREVRPGDIIPQAALEKARKLAAKRVKDGTVAQQKPFEMTGIPPGLVAFYAAQRFETAPERPPYDGSSDQNYGLLTHTLCKILTEAKSKLTYRELAQRIYAYYVQNGRHEPTPLIEGTDKDQNREVFGMKIWPDRSRFTLRKDGKVWKITGGGLHGLTQGSVLAVYPPAGKADADKPLGHVRIHKSHPVEAEVVPVAFGKLAAPKVLPVGGRVELASLDYGTMRLKVGVDYGGQKPGGELQKLEEELRKRAKEPTALFQVMAKGQAADWLLQKRDGRVVLLPADVARRIGKLPEVIPQFGPYTADELDELQDKLASITRASNLLKLTKSVSGLGGEETRAGAASASAVKVKVVMLKYDKDGKNPQPVTWKGGGITLADGERVKFLIDNLSLVTVDVSLLYIDSQFGIRAFWPQPGTATENRLPPGDSRFVGPVPIEGNPANGDTIGLEHMVVIAVRAEGPPIDFTCLAQPTLTRAEQAKTRGDAKKTLGSPLGKLFQKALYARGTARSIGKEMIDNYEMRLLSWNVIPSPSVEAKK